VLAVYVLSYGPAMRLTCSVYDSSTTKCIHYEELHVLRLYFLCRQ
jgi:hypothetical protein